MNFLKQMFSDVDGQGSHKRLIVFGIFILIAAIVIGVTFCKATFQANIWDDLIYTLIAGLGMITSEKFTTRSLRTETDKSNA